MSRVVAIVEGDGEVQALPVLLRRISEWLTPGQYVDVAAPIRVRRDRFLNRPDEFNRHIHLAAGKCGDDGWILVVLDADDDCPVELGQQILARAAQAAPHRQISIVLANREYEAWFLAACQSLDGCRAFSWTGEIDFDPEGVRDAKGWMRARMNGTAYREVTDQPAFSARMDLESARRHSRSFRKLCEEWERQVRPAPTGDDYQEI